MNFQQKEIVLLPYPFSDQKESKVRPAVIISNNNFNKKSEDCVMLPLTSVIKEVPYSILISQEDLSSGKLLKPSRIRIDKIFTINQNLARMKIGIINTDVFKKIKSEIFKIF
jgi:mRNA interferase MazF